LRALSLWDDPILYVPLAIALMMIAEIAPERIVLGDRPHTLQWEESETARSAVVVAR
jgi:hypothetical protein